MTLHPLCTNPFAIFPKVTHGYETPVKTSTFLPSSGPHSYTRRSPYGLAIYRPPCKQSGGRGNPSISSRCMPGSNVFLGDWIAGSVLVNLLHAIPARTKYHAPHMARPDVANLSGVLGAFQAWLILVRSKEAIGCCGQEHWRQASYNERGYVGVFSA